MAADPAPPIRLAVDVMGGDHGPSVTLPACRAFLAAHPEAELLLVGRAEALARRRRLARAARRVAASEVVEMTDSVETALRTQEGLVDARRDEPGQAARRPRRRWPRPASPPATPAP